MTVSSIRRDQEPCDRQQSNRQRERENSRLPRHDLLRKQARRRDGCQHIFRQIQKNRGQLLPPFGILHDTVMSHQIALVKPCAIRHT